MGEEGFYPGSNYGLDPNYGLIGTSGYGNFSGYRIGVEKFGFPTDLRTANQLAAVSKKLESGAKTIEVSALDIFGRGPMKMIDTIPKQQFKEIDRLRKLSGVELTMHGPLVEPTGISRQGFEDTQRQIAEREMWSAVERGHKMDPKGNLIVTFHSSSGLPETEKTVIDEKTGKKVTTEVMFVDKRTGNFTRVAGPMQKEYLKENPEITIKEQIQKQTDDEWYRNLQHISFNAYAGINDLAGNLSGKEGVIGEKGKESILDFYKTYVKNPQDAEKFIQTLNQNNPGEGDVIRDKMLGIVHADIYLRDSYQSLKNEFNTAYEAAKESGNEKDLAILEKFRKDMVPAVGKFEKDPSKLREFATAVVNGVNVLRQVSPPKKWTPLRDFAVDKAADTFAGVAFKSYKKFRENSPIISIENPPVGTGLATGEDLRDLVKATRKKFVERAVDKLGMSEDAAKDQAEKLIGVTWDVGHINMLRKHGFEEKHIVKETEKIAKMVKHVHLSDNFGLEHTELPMGMGNVPTKKHLELIDKYNKQAKKIVETGDWFSQQGLSQAHSPFLETLRGFGSPAYGGVPNPPYWNQIADTSGYFFAGLGEVNPQLHHQMWGAGFSNLPIDLGGQLVGKSRASGGTPFE